MEGANREALSGEDYQEDAPPGVLRLSQPLHSALILFRRQMSCGSNPGLFHGCGGYDVERSFFWMLWRSSSGYSTEKVLLSPDLQERGIEKRAMRHAMKVLRLAGKPIVI